MVTEALDLPLNPCTICGGDATLLHVSWAQPRYMAHCTVSRHFDPTVGRDHTTAGRTPDEAQTAWNQLNPLQPDTHEE